MLLRFLHDHFIRVAPTNLGYEAVLIHDPRYLFVVHNDAIFREFHLNRSPAVLGLSLAKQLVDFEVVVVVFFWLVCLFQVFVVAAS